MVQLTPRLQRLVLAGGEPPFSVAECRAALEATGDDVDAAERLLAARRGISAELPVAERRGPTAQAPAVAELSARSKKRLSFPRMTPLPEEKAEAEEEQWGEQPRRLSEVGAAIRIQAVVRGRLAREQLQEAARVQWIRFWLGQGEMDRARALMLPGEEAALLGAASADGEAPQEVKLNGNGDDKTAAASPSSERSTSSRASSRASPLAAETSSAFTTSL